jgi:glycosyltransferase involved in cell wall biosynthesis
MASTEPELSFLVISHAAIHGDQDIFGPAHNVVEHLNACGHPVDFVMHPIHGDAAGFVRTFRGGELTRQIRPPYRGRAGEVLSNARLLGNTEANVIVLVDPLNYVSALSPSPRRRRKPRVCVYFTADYADRRFEATLMNALYHALDRLALRHADLVWSVSKRIAARRATQGVKEKDSFVIPNSPPYLPAAVVPWAERAHESAVCVGMIDSILDWDLLVDTIALLSPDRPQLRVRLVGAGPDRSSLLGRLRAKDLERHVELCGVLPHEAALDVVSTSRVGLALYSRKAVWGEYRDSVKVREYVARGVPVVSTRHHPLADELQERGAGHAVESAEEAAAAIANLLDDRAGIAAERALGMAADADRTAVLTNAILECERRLRER